VIDKSRLHLPEIYAKFFPSVYTSLNSVDLPLWQEHGQIICTKSDTDLNSCGSVPCVVCHKES
jgi:hypothetical protein